MEKIRNEVYVLLIANQVDLGNNLETALRREGYWIWVASSVPQAMDLLSTVADIDVVVIDIGIQEGRGHEILEAIEKQGLCTAIVAIMDTHHFDMIMKADRYSIYGYISKPVDMDQLRPLLTGACEYKRNLLVEREKESCETKAHIQQGISSQIYTPMEAIAGILRKSEGDITGSELAHLKSQFGRLQTTLTKLQELSSSSDTLQLSLHQLLKEAVAESKLPTGIQVCWHLNHADFLVKGNSSLKPAFLNLIQNAGEAMPEGGIVTLATSRQADMVEIGIADTGIGMSPEVQPRIFDPFYTTKNQTGLGLNMALEVVQTLNGKLLIEKSEPDRGTQIKVMLPLIEKM